MQILARLTMDRPDGQRAGGRRRIRMEADRIDVADGPQDIVIHDLSFGGCSFASPVPIAPGVPLRLRIPEVGEVAARATWIAEGRVGCAFDVPLSPAELGGALATSPVVWGDFPENERTLAAGSGERAMTLPPGSMAAPASYREVTPEERWPIGIVALTIGAALVAFWAGVAALV